MEEKQIHDPTSNTSVRVKWKTLQRLNSLKSYETMSNDEFLNLLLDMFVRLKEKAES